VSLGATDPVAENQTVHCEQGSGIRRLVSRESAIISDGAIAESGRWAAAYSAEPPGFWRIALADTNGNSERRRRVRFAVSPLLARVDGRFVDCNETEVVD
jgi:hypothetical protein